MLHLTTIPDMHSADPVHALVFSWWHLGITPKAPQVPALRHQLLQSILTHHREQIAQGISYDPFNDSRVLWAAHYLDKIENPFLRSDPDITARAAFSLRIPIDHTPCGKDLAAGL